MTGLQAEPRLVHSIVARIDLLPYARRKPSGSDGVNRTHRAENSLEIQTAPHPPHRDPSSIETVLTTIASAWCLQRDRRIQSTSKIAHLQHPTPYEHVYYFICGYISVANVRRKILFNDTSVLSQSKGKSCDTPAYPKIDRGNYKKGWDRLYKGK